MNDRLTGEQLIQAIVTSYRAGTIVTDRVLQDICLALCDGNVTKSKALMDEAKNTGVITQKRFCGWVVVD